MAREKRGSKDPAVHEGSAQANRLRFLVESSPLAQTLGDEAVQLPKVQAPSLDGIEVTVPRAENPTEDDLAERLHAYAREIATQRDRKEGEAVQAGDDVQIDALGYANGRLLPFSARAGVWLEVSPMPGLPGFAEGLVGKKVGEGTKIEITLPEDFPTEFARGAQATFLVDIRAAREVKMPDLESKAFLDKLGKGRTLEAVMKALAQEIEDELVDQLWVEAQDLVLDEVARRSGAQVPEALVDLEIRRRWQQAEGPLLNEKGFSPDEQQEALAGWLSDPLTRADAARRIRISLALKAVIERDKLELTPEKLKDLLKSSAKAFGFDAEEVGDALAGEEALSRQVSQIGYHLLAVEHVMERAKVRFEGAQPS